MHDWTLDTALPSVGTTYNDENYNTTIRRFNAGGQIHLELTLNAGSPNAAYNTAGKSWTLANFDSEEADYVNGDVGNELLALAAGDKFELLVTHEASADPDGETDAVFGSLEVGYV